MLCSLYSELLETIINNRELWYIRYFSGFYIRRTYTSVLLRPLSLLDVCPTCVRLFLLFALQQLQLKISAWTSGREVTSQPVCSCTPTLAIAGREGWMCTVNLAVRQQLTAALGQQPPDQISFSPSSQRHLSSFPPRTWTLMHDVLLWTVRWGIYTGHMMVAGTLSDGRVSLSLRLKEEEQFLHDQRRYVCIYFHYLTCSLCVRVKGAFTWCRASECPYLKRGPLPAGTTSHVLVSRL